MAEQTPEFLVTSSDDAAAEVLCLSERRTGQDCLPVPSVGKLIHGGQDMICRVRDLSSNGFIAEVTPPPSQGSAVLLEMTEGEGLEGIVAWVRHESIGVEFIDPHEPGRILAGGRLAGDLRPRAARFRVHGYATVVVGLRQYDAAVLNISQKGMSIEMDHVLATGQEIVAAVDGLDGYIKATVRWCRAGRIGVNFHESLGYNDLAHWLWADRNAELTSLRRAS